MIKLFFNLFFLIGFYLTLPAQNNFDSISILNFLKQKDLIYEIKGLSDEEIAKTPSYQAKIEFDSLTNIWTVKSVKYSTSNCGKCRKTNGCTVEKSLIVKLNDDSQKLISKKKQKRKIPNFE